MTNASPSLSLAGKSMVGTSALPLGLAPVAANSFSAVTPVPVAVSVSNSNSKPNYSTKSQTPSNSTK